MIELGIARDTLEDTSGGIRRARDLGADVLVTTGGASVGDHDLVQAALKAEGFDMAFWKIALRPGKPMMNGRLGAMRDAGLPGNPVSSYVCAFLFLVPLIRSLSGRTMVDHPLEHARGRTRTARQRQAAGLPAARSHPQRRYARRHLGGRPRQFAGGQSRCRQRANRPAATCPSRPRRLALHDPPAAKLTIPDYVGPSLT